MYGLRLNYFFQHLFEKFATQAREILYPDTYMNWLARRYFIHGKLNASTAWAISGIQEKQSRKGHFYHSSLHKIV